MSKRLFLACAMLLLAEYAHAQITEVALTAGKSARLKKAATGKASAAVKFMRDQALSVVPPTCPVVSWLRLRSLTDTNTVQDTGPIFLPCASWMQKGSSLRYSDRSASVGGVQSMTYKLGTLAMKLKSPGFPGQAGPVQWMEARFTVGSTSYCGKFSTFKRNGTEKIISKGPTAACDPLCGNGAVDPGEQCDDGNAASGDCCSSTCQFEPSGSPCTDGTACTSADACDGGGTCTGTAVNCDDGNPCTDETCQAASGCVYTNNSNPCTDGTVCTDGDVCSGGTCVPGPALNCDDANLCTADSCGSIDGCVHTPQVGATCQGDGNFCTDDLCDGSGACTHTNNSRPCNDGQSCTVNDTCVAGTCTGTYIKPWINEVDYDDLAGLALGDLLLDRDEFIEITGPAGLDLSGYYIVSVEGNQACLTGIDPNTGFNTPTGNAHFITQIPQGRILGDDSGSGIGFYVACFMHPVTGVSTSDRNGAACDDTLPAINSDENLKNGNLLNANPDGCPDGVLLLDPAGNVVDAVSWEGVVPDTGPLTFGNKFYDPAVVPPYSIGRDEGGAIALFLFMDAPHVSLEKSTNTLQRAHDATEWKETGGCVNQDLGELLLGTCVTNTATPGGLNAMQSAPNMQCTTIAPGCGNGIVDAGEDCESDGDCGSGWVCTASCVCQSLQGCGNGRLDPGEQCDEGVHNNSNAPNATCREDCTPRRCGDGIVDDQFAEQCDDGANNSNEPGSYCKTDCTLQLCGNAVIDPGEECESGGDCASGSCVSCLCALGPLAFSIGPGPSDFCPADGTPGTWVRTDGTPGGGPFPAVLCNATANNWTDVPAVTKGSLPLFGGHVDPLTGKAPLTLAQPQVFGAHMPGASCAASNPGCVFNPGNCACRLCYRIEQDPAYVSDSFVDCDGGTNVDVRYVVDSNGSSPPGAGVALVPAVGVGPDSGAGAALLYVLVKSLQTADQALTCPDVGDMAWDSVTATDEILTTGVGEATINNPRVCAGIGMIGLHCPNTNPYQVIMSGSPLNCAIWAEDTGAQFVMPGPVLDQDLGPAGVGDLAQATRLTD